MKIISFYGPQRAGKSTAANAVVSDNHTYHKASFADPIYRALSAILQTNARELNKEIPVLCGKSPRRLLQLLGTEWGRQMVGENVWIECMHRHLQYLEKIGARLVAVDDLRFANEYDYLEGRGATIIKIERPTESMSPDDSPGQSHASEQDWRGFIPDRTIVNCGSEGELRQLVRNIVFGRMGVEQ